MSRILEMWGVEFRTLELNSGSIGATFLYLVLIYRAIENHKNFWRVRSFKIFRILEV